MANRELLSASQRCMYMLMGCFLAITLTDSMLQVSGSTTSAAACFSGLFIFGDSLVETGNAAVAFPARFNKTTQQAALSGFGKAAVLAGTGVRFSDVGDFTARALGLSPPSAYLNRNQSSQLSTGTNFAVGGSTVLDDYPTGSLSDPNFLLTRTPFNLETQIQWWRDLKSQVNFKATDGQLPPVNESLHFVLMGATDYLLQYSSNFSQHQVLASVPFIVNRIAKSLEELHVYGAQTVVAVNLPPLGCTSAFLSMFPGNSEDYDAYGCLKTVNTAILRHNQKLFRAVSRLQRTYKSMSSFVYADFYKSTYDIVENPEQFGYDKAALLKACCGVGETYNFSQTSTCGGTWVSDDGVEDQVPACGYPSSRLTWDGFHFSESVARTAVMNFFQEKHVQPANGLVPNYCKPNFASFQQDDAVVPETEP
ncbi:hypothetical protein R1flu_017568 [Riccia fluitans]|uniref:GDSL esterase/lipase n=1 Tax=Riccia fluitans TaxID=41844 RepID=A0ABD1ZDB5_9MARC